MSYKHDAVNFLYLLLLFGTLSVDIIMQLVNVAYFLFVPVGRALFPCLPRPR